MTRRSRRKQRNGHAPVMPGDKSVSFRYERYIIAGLCIAAAIRVFIFCAAFPFFNNVDEQAHSDMVFKYARRHLPAAPLEKYDPKTVRIIVDSADGGYFDTAVDRSPSAQAQVMEYLTRKNNPETWVWPVYYLAAGIWCRVGELMVITSTRLLYWIRFFNVILIVIFVWVSWLCSRRFYGDNWQGRIAVPLLAAFFPQDIFYGITGDVLSPVVFAAAFLMLLEICLEDKSWKYHFFAGLLVAATFLTKASNIAIIPLAAVVMLIKIIRAAREGQFKSYLPSVIVFSFAAAIPVAVWLGRNYVLFGDAIGSAASIKERTWRVKPLSEMFHHPIFTFSGCCYFLAELTRTFWRGEFIWRLKIMALPSMDMFYIVSSAVLLVVCILGLIWNKAGDNKPRRFIVVSSLLVITASVLFLVFMSMRYDFGKCMYPSVDKPYFTSGRLIAGCILPFLLLYVEGLRRILSKLRCGSILLFAAAVIAAVITVSEVVLTWPVFASHSNWFHIMK